MSNSTRSIHRAAAIMFLYALVILALSLLAYLIAPPGANAMTAIVMGAGSSLVMIVMAVMSLMIERNRKLGMIGIHIGLILPLVFAVAFFARIDNAYGSSGVNRYFENAFAEKVADGAQQDTEDARRAFFAESEDDLAGADIPETDKAYLGHTLTLLFGASTAAFVLLLLSRPKVPKAETDAFGDTGTPAEASGEKSVTPFA